jgi:hypothetical protein
MVNLCSLCNIRSVYCKNICLSCYQKFRYVKVIRINKILKNCSRCNTNNIYCKGLCFSCYRSLRYENQFIKKCSSCTKNINTKNENFNFTDHNYLCSSCIKLKMSKDHYKRGVKK